MLRLSLRGLSAVLGGLVLSSTVGAGIASADPDLDLAINTTCSYPQVIAALNAQDPQFGKALSLSRRYCSAAYVSSWQPARKSGRRPHKTWRTPQPSSPTLASWNRPTGLVTTSDFINGSRRAS